uniref:Cytochrome b n=1 Tax=Chordodes sp. VVA-2019 TaxID=2586751 RepID=A0A514ABV4_9BILA|nr:cytochrome b [Chordodes sp. VVA-2019]
MMKNFSNRKKNEMKLLNNFLFDLPTPININFWWNFGSLLGVFLLTQIISGVLLTMNYSPSLSAFMMLINLEKNNWEGFLMRYIHVMGASFLFMLIYLHMFRSLYYKSFLINKMTWVSGVTIFFMMMMIAFLGYVLPWGQMSYWAATVITNMMSAIPFIGKDLVVWMWGGFSVGLPTLNRFYTFHFLMPFILLMIILMHLIFLHKKNSNNPIIIPSKLYMIPFHSMFTYKDLLGFIIPFFILTILTFQTPDLLNDVANFIEANPLSTPAHIMPEWYFLFAYGILRSVPNKLGGVIAMLMSILILYFLVLTKKYKINKYFNFFMTNLSAMNFIILSFIGSQVVEQPFINMGILFSILYFLTFIITMYL